jgi:hypothetical protein
MGRGQLLDSSRQQVKCNAVANSNLDGFINVVTTNDLMV